METNTTEMLILIKYDGDLLREKKLLTTCCSLFKQALKKNLIGVSNYDVKDLKIYLIDTLGYAGENDLELYELPISYCPFCGIKFHIKSVLEN